MTGFTDTLSMVTIGRDRLTERVQDAFGASLVAEVFDPMIFQSSGLLALAEEAEETMQQIDEILDEARSIGGNG